MLTAVAVDGAVTSNKNINGFLSTSWVSLLSTLLYSVKCMKANSTASKRTKICLNLAKKLQLHVIVLIKRNLILKVLFKMVAMATIHTLLR